MAYEQRDNSGTLGLNNRKEKESHPDWRGQCIIGGVEYWISAWIKRNGTTGEEFFSLAFQEKEARPNLNGPRPPSGLNSGGIKRPELKKPEDKKPQQSFDNFEDDIPFD